MSVPAVPTVSSGGAVELIVQGINVRFTGDERSWCAGLVPAKVVGLR